MSLGYIKIKAIMNTNVVKSLLSCLLEPHEHSNAGVWQAALDVQMFDSVTKRLHFYGNQPTNGSFLVDSAYKTGTQQYKHGLP